MVSRASIHRLLLNKVYDSAPYIFNQSLATHCDNIKRETNLENKKFLESAPLQGQSKSFGASKDKSSAECNFGTGMKRQQRRDGSGWTRRYCKASF